MDALNFAIGRVASLGAPHPLSVTYSDAGLPAGTYRIKNSRSGTYITCSPDDPNTIYGWDSSPDNDLQKWQLIKTGGFYNIRNVGNGRYMSKHRHDGQGARISATQDPTRWYFSELESGAWFIAVEGSDLCADLHWGRNENGMPIHIWGKSSVSHKTWRFKRVKSHSSDGLARSLDQARERLAAVEKTVKDQQKELSELKGQLDSTRNKLLEAEKNVEDARGRVSTVESSVAARENQLSKLGIPRAPSLRGPPSSPKNQPQSPPQSLTSHARGWVDLFGRSTETSKVTSDISPQQGGSASPQIEQRLLNRSPEKAQGGFCPPPPEPSLSLSHQLTGLDTAAPTVKTETDIPMPPVETQEYLTSIGKFIRTMERRVPAIEAQAGKLEISLVQTQEELSALRISSVTTGERLAGLDRRIAMGESRTDKIMEVLDEIRDAEAENWPGLSSFRETEINFPSRA